MFLIKYIIHLSSSMFLIEGFADIWQIVRGIRTTVPFPMLQKGYTKIEKSFKKKIFSFIRKISVMSPIFQDGDKQDVMNYWARKDW